MFDGAKLNDTPDGVGVELEQFIAQHKRAASAAGVLSLLLALSQHFIIWSRGECKRVPADTSPASTKSKKSNVKRLTIIRDSSIVQTHKATKNRFSFMKILTATGLKLQKPGAEYL